MTDEKKLFIISLQKKKLTKEIMAAVETKIEKPVENAEEINEKVLNNEGGDVAQNDGAKKQKKPKPNKKTGEF